MIVRGPFCPPSPWINKNTDRTLDVVFSRFRGFSFIITLRQKPKEVTRMLSFCLVIQHCMPIQYCTKPKLQYSTKPKLQYFTKPKTSILY